MYSNVNLTQQVKDKFKENGSIKRGYIKVLETDTQEEIVYDESSLKDFTILDDIYTPSQGLIGSIISKQIELNFFNEQADNLENREIEAYIGISDNGNITYIPMGKFIIQKPEDNKVTEKTYFIGLDYMTKFNLPFKNAISYPCTLKQLLQNICNQCDVELATTSFTNENFIVENNQFVGGESCRDVLRAIAQVSGTYAQINKDGKLELKFVDVSKTTNNNTEKYTTYDYTKEMSVNITTKPINRIVLAMSGIDGIETIYPTTEIPEDEVSQIIITDNPFLYTSEKRQQVIENLYNALKNFSYTDYNINVLTPRPYQDTGDTIIVTAPDGTEYVTYLFTHEIKFNGGLKATLSATAETDVETKYSYKPQTQKAQTRTEYIVDKANAEIRQYVSEEVGNVSSSISEITTNLEGITSRVESFTDFTRVKKSKDEETGIISNRLYLGNDVINTNVVKLEIEAENVESAIFPSTTLYPSNTLYPRKAGNVYTIFVANDNMESIYTEYNIELISPLLTAYGTHDKLIIELDQETGNSVVYTERWVRKTGNVYEILSSPNVEIIYENLPVVLYKGSNYIKLLVDGDEKSWNFIVTYIVDNELNKYYTTQIQSSSLIKSTKDSILLQVTQGLGEKADKDKIISQINLSTEEININSNKISLEGYTTINGGFSVDEQGNASIANGAVVIDDNGITMQDGTSVVGGKGFLTNLEFIGRSNLTDTMSGSFGQVGFRPNSLTSSNFRAKITIDTYIPDNFIIESAYAILMHYPLDVRYQSTSRGYGYARQVKLYREASLNIVRVWNVDSAFFDAEEESLIEINDNNLGSSGWTPNMNDDTTLDIVKTNDISSSLNTGLNRLIVQTSEAIPNFSSAINTQINNCYLHTGQMCAILEVYGYMSNSTK